MKRTTTGLVIAGAFATMLCSSALEAAADGQPITACVMPGTGLLRIPPDGQGCKPQETPLSFNDLPLLVALQKQVNDLISEVAGLQAAVAALQTEVAQLQACIACAP